MEKAQKAIPIGKVYLAQNTMHAISVAKYAINWQGASKI